MKTFVGVFLVLVAAFTGSLPTKLDAKSKHKDKERKEDDKKREVCPIPQPHPDGTEGATGPAPVEV